jgi:hypothetical protein
LRGFAVKTELVTSAGDHVRYVPAELARALVAAGYAEIHNANGKVKAIRLLTAATTHACRIGDASVPMGPPACRFTRWVRLEQSATRVIEHHPRCTYE